MRVRVFLAFAVIPLVFANLATAAPNEICAGAVPLTLGSSITASTEDVADSLESTGCGKEDRYALWYSFDAPATGAAGTGGLSDGTAGNGTSEGGGCGCRTANSETRSPWAIALAVVALVFRRRRTR